MPNPQSLIPTAESRPTLRRRLRWLALAAVPSSLLLGVTAHISTDIASVPFLWVIPLMLYLLSFVLVFSRWRSFGTARGPGCRRPGWSFSAGRSSSATRGTPRRSSCSWRIHLAAFFLTAMVCHGGLAGDRPASDHLTEFYLWLSLGGVLGGLFGALWRSLLFWGCRSTR